MYQEGDLTHYLQPLTNCTLHRCWSECMEKFSYHVRRKQIAEFNDAHRWKKRGLALVPNKFGIGFPVCELNQAGALLHVYKDGSVLLHHGGVEIGQGINTKMIQIASKLLKIPSSKIIIMDCSTDKIPNTSSTAASVTSDLNGGAVMVGKMFKTFPIFFRLTYILLTNVSECVRKDYEKVRTLRK